MKIAIFFTLLLVSLFLKSSSTSVIELTSNNFQKEVIDSSDNWLIEFYGKGLFI
jgi:hypothetical protein